MGIGAGGDLDTSGEKIVHIRKLKHLYAKRKQPLVVFDVGANKGLYSRMIIDNLQGIPLTIHAFEPSQHTYKVLCDNLKNLPNCFLNNFGLGKESGQFELFYDEVGSGLASLSKRRLAHFGADMKLSEKVTIKTLDDYCRESGVKNIDLLKLDVEGHELDVLMGGMRMLQERKIRMLSFEFGGCNIDTKTYFQDFWYFFKDTPMNCIYRITPSGYLVPLLEYKDEYETLRCTNFLVLQSDG